MRLCLLLTEHKTGNQPATFALLSLMCFHASRFDSRVGEDNNIILLQYQDRRTWNRELINRGYAYLEKSSQGTLLTVYHLESAIAAEHCQVPSFTGTNWPRLLQLYDLLLEVKKTPHVQLNRAIVLAQLEQLTTAIQEIRAIEHIDDLLHHQYIFSAVLGDLYAQYGDVSNARKFLQLARILTTSLAEKKLINDKLSLIGKTGMN